MLKQALFVCALILSAVCSVQTAQAQYPGHVVGPNGLGDRWAQSYAAGRPWHGNYYYLPYGQPTALVVPPTSTMQTNYSWGVSQNTMTPIYHQFGRAVPTNPGYGVFYGTPRWPSHTDQFGVYPVRGPW
ncbi:MAG: hypothetical protein U0892_17035 [Pirellulales bacterium]